MGVGGRRSRREIDVYTRARVRVALGRARRRRVDRAVVRRGGGRYVVMKSFIIIMHACMHSFVVDCRRRSRGVLWCACH